MSECRPKAMSSQRGRKARAGLRTDLGRHSDSDDSDSDYEDSNDDSYVRGSTQGVTQISKTLNWFSLWLKSRFFDLG